MSYKTSPLIHLIREITGQDIPQPQWSWDMKFEVLPESGIDLTDEDLARSSTEKMGFYEPIVFTNLDIIADYEKAFCDHVNMIVQVPAGMWLKVLSPYREFLRVHLVRERRVYQNGPIDIEEDPLVLIFKPIFKDSAEAHETVSETMRLTRAELDIRNVLSVDLDLLDPATEAVQAAACGGIWRRHKTSDVLQGVFADVCSQMTYEGEKLITAQVISDRTNPDKMEHISILPGTPLVDLPLILQKEQGGIWSTGCGYFLSDKTWYFYPPYDTTRVLRERFTLTIVLISDIAGQGAKHTYLKDADHLKIIAASESQIQDMTQRNFLTLGDGTRFTKASTLMDDWVVTKDNKAVANRATANTEVRLKADKQTDHRTFNAAKRITDNAYDQYSALASRQGQLLSFTWMYADHTLLKPGMACRVLYDVDGEIKELHGVLVGRHAAIQATERAVSIDNYVTSCAMFVFCNEPTQ